MGVSVYSTLSGICPKSDRSTRPFRSSSRRLRVRAGPAVTQWKPGDRVLGFSPQPWSGIGAIAERIALPPDLIAALPAGLDFTQGSNRGKYVLEVVS